MTNAQLYLAIGVPMLFNAILAMLFLAYVNAKFEAVSARLEALEKNMSQRFEAVNQRFVDMEKMWRSELQRVEQLIGPKVVIS